MTVTLLVAAPASAQPDSAGTLRFDHDDFLQLAQEVGGLTAEEAGNAWGDPEQVAAIPVATSLVPLSVETEVLAPQVDPGTELLLPAAQRTVTYRAFAWNSFCQGIASVNITKTWTYNGSSVTHVSSSRPAWNGALNYFQQWVSYDNYYMEGLGNPHAYHRT